MVKYIIPSSSFNIIEISGDVYIIYYDLDELKEKISQDSSIPLDKIKNLENMFGTDYSIDDFERDNTIYVKTIDVVDQFFDYDLFDQNYNNFYQEDKKDSMEKDLSDMKYNYSILNKKYNNLESQYNDNKYQITKLEWENNSNKKQITKLEKENNSNKKQIKNLITKNENLNYQLQKERKIREQKEENFQKMKNAFEKSMQTIEIKNIEESKKYIEKYIANVFLKEFEVKKEKKSEFKISLTSRMQTFTQEFMTFCHKFINCFKSNTDKIIKEFDVKNNNTIEHINFIVIGKAGVGKSSFINESLKLSENKRAKEGIGLSVTKESILYNSDKLKMVRMWDTQGLDYNITQEYILNEVKRIVEDGLKKGPDHYINIILYCTMGDRFQNEDGKLIKEIMKLYPFDNLPVVITQLQAYFKQKAQKMEEAIRNILDNYLDNKIVKKIEIKSIVARDFIDEVSDFKCEAYGIPELLRLSFDIMGRSISSATCKKLSRDIENLCKDFVDKKILYIQNIFKYEMEILELAKRFFVEELDEDDDYFGNKKKHKKKELSECNMYRKIENPNFFVDNFCKIMSDKFIDIFNNLESGNIQLNQINIANGNENEEKKNNEQEKNNNQENNIKENTQQKNMPNKINQQEKKEEEKKKKKEENEEQKENKEEEKDVNDKPAVAFLVEERLEKLRKSLDEASNKTFEKIFKNRYQNYLIDLQREQSIKNKEFNDNSQIIDVLAIENNFKEKLLTYFKNEFFKIFFCIILKLFMNNLNDILMMNVQKELKENENVQKIISQKAENSLKTITEKLKKNLIYQLDEFMRKKRDAMKKAKKANEFDKENVDFAF